jgi:DNA sulfur modification protein DndB
VLKNVSPRKDLGALVRKKARTYILLTIDPRDLDRHLTEGWRQVRKNKRSIVIARPKAGHVLFEDRVWVLMYRMGFPFLSGEGGALVVINPGSDREVENQIDVLAMDSEVCIAIECKTSQVPKRRPQFQQELAKFHGFREPLVRGARALYASTHKRMAIQSFFTENVVLGDNDRVRADQNDVTLFDQDDLEYYESLVQHLGYAARFQLLADMIPGKRVPGLVVRLPAIRTKMGPTNAYVFSMRADELLKVAYISHRAKGKASDVDAYQRMVSKPRLKAIRQYISGGGIFPTNIVLNLDTGPRGGQVQFERSAQIEENEFATVGWLTIRPTYKSAWIIDGQHRLFAYSGHPLAASSFLPVLAFEGLDGSEQMRLFSDINAKQKSVKKSLLQELYADLHMFASDPVKRVQAIISRSIQGMGLERDSPLYARILLADSVRTPLRCISLTSMFAAIDKPGLYYRQVRAGVVVDPGPLWEATNEGAIRRSITILKGWFAAVAEAVPDWWDLGSAEGGGLAMNNGVVICINVLRSVAEHLRESRTHLADMSPSEVVERLHPYAAVLGQHFGSLSPQQRADFRTLAGVQGQTAGTRHAQQFIRERFPSFDPPGLQEYLAREKANTNDEATKLVLAIERLLHEHVLAEVKAAFSEEGDVWWYEGVPDAVRRPVALREQDDKGKAGSKEAYLDLIHYRDIIEHNWQTLGPLFGYGKSGKKSVKTGWIAYVNEVRKVAMHGSRGATVTFEQLAALREYLLWLEHQVSGAGMDDSVESDEFAEDLAV